MINSDINYKNLKQLLPQLLKVDLYKGKKFECCPHCNSVFFIKHGKYKGIQRYKCNNCNRTFSNTTNSLWYYSKKDANTWFKYIELLLQRKTLKECAEELNLNVATAFYWRHKIINILKSAHIYGINPEKFIGNASAKIIDFKEKKYNSVINFGLDPYHEQNYIIAAAVKDSEDSMAITPLNRFSFTMVQFDKKVISKLDQKSSVLLDGKERISKVPGNGYNCSHLKRCKNKVAVTDEKFKNIGMIISEWFSIFHGIATKYLEKYLSYFLLYHLDYCFDSTEMSYSLVKFFGFIKTNNIKKSELSL